MDQTPPAVQPKRWDVWAVGTGLFGHYDNFGDGHYSAGQFSIGLDYRVTPHWLVGVIADYTYTTGTWDGRNFNANTFRGGLYTSVWKGGWYGTLAGLIGTTDYHVRGGTTSGMDYTGYAGTGYAWRFGSFEIGPWAGLEYDYADGFRPLRELASRIGVRAAFHAGKWTPYVQIGWQHEYLDDWTGIDRNSAWGSTGVAYRINDAFSVFANYSGWVGPNDWVQQVDVGARFSW